MAKKTGFSKFLKSIGIDDVAQEKLRKNTDEAGEIIGNVGDKILGTMADTIETSKPLAKKAYKKAGEGLDKAGVFVDDVMKDFSKPDSVEEKGSEADSTKEEVSETDSSDEKAPEKAEKTVPDEEIPEEEVEVKVEVKIKTNVDTNVRTPEQLKSIQDITAGLDYFSSAVQECKIKDGRCSNILRLTSLVKQVLNNSVEPFDELMEKGQNVLDNLKRMVSAMAETAESEEEIASIQNLSNSLAGLSALLKISMVPEEKAEVDDDTDQVIEGFNELFSGVFSILGEAAETLNETVNPKEATQAKDSESSSEKSINSESGTDSKPKTSAKPLDERGEEVFDSLKKWFETEVIPNVENASKEVTSKMGDLMEEMGKKIKEKTDGKK